MNKEKEPIYNTDGGYSEKQMDLAVDQGKPNNDQVKASTIFDPKKKKKNNKVDTIEE